MIYFASFSYIKGLECPVADIYQGDLELGVLTQFNTLCGTQDMGKSLISLELQPNGTLKALFTDGTSSDIPGCSKYSSLNEELGEKLTQQFDNLQRGLNANNPKTIEWLKQKGIIFHEAQST